MATSERIGQELAVPTMDNQHFSNGLKYLNLPTSMDLTSLLTKLEQSEKELYPHRPQLNPKKLIQRVKLIELDSYRHQSIHSQQLHHLQLSVFHKTRLFLAVGFGVHVVVGQLFALELRQIHDEACEGGRMDGGEDLEDEEELEWVDVSNIRLPSCLDNPNIESKKEEKSGQFPVIIFPPEHADSLPYYHGQKGNNEKEQTQTGACDFFGAEEITSCALIPSPAIKLDRQISSQLLTQRSVAVVLGTSQDRVVSFSMYVSEMKTDLSSSSNALESPLEIMYDNIKFALEYDSCKNYDGGKVTDPRFIVMEDGDTIKRGGAPFIQQILPSQGRYQSVKGGIKNSAADETNTPSNPSSQLVGVFDGNVDAHVQVFHPSLPAPHSFDSNSSSNVQHKTESAYFGITSISFCRGQLNPNCVQGSDGTCLLVPDIVWIVYGNGTMVKLPSWKFFLSFGAPDVLDEKDGVPEKASSGFSTGGGVSVVPLNGHYQSPLDVPPPQFNQLGVSSGTSVGIMECDGLKGSSASTCGGSEDYWRNLPHAIIGDLKEQRRGRSNHHKNMRAIVLSESSSAGSSLPFGFQSTRVECGPIQPESTPSDDEVMMASENDEPQAQEDKNDGENASDSSSSGDENYGPVTGAVVGGTAALVKGALGAAFGAVRWGFGGGGNADIDEDDDDEMSEFIDADETLDDNQGQLPDGNDDYQALFAKQEKAKDLFPWPLSNASYMYSDVPRQFVSAVIDPSGTLAATTDSLGRVMLFDLETCQVIRMWKGMRNVTCAFAELPRSDRKNNSRLESCIYLVIHLQQRGTVEVYRLRQGPRVEAVSVPQRDDCVVVECSGPPSEGCMVHSFMLMEEDDSVSTAERHYTMDYLVIEDEDALAKSIAGDNVDSNLGRQRDNGLQLKLLMQLLAPDTNIKCNAQTVLVTFKKIRAIADLGEGLDILSKCSELEDRMGVTGSDFHSQVISHCKARLDFEKKIEAKEGSGMIRKATITDLSLKIAYHERLVRAYNDLYQFELRNDRKSSDGDDADEWEARRLSTWASEAVSWISVSDGNDAQNNRFASSISGSHADETPLRFSKFATACSITNSKKKNVSDIDGKVRVHLSGIKKDRKPLLARIFRPLQHDLFVYKVTNAIFTHLGMHEDFEALQQYFGEWSLTLSSISIAKSNLSGTWRPMVRFLQDLIMSAYEKYPDKVDDVALQETAQLGALLKFVTEIEDLPKAFTLSVVCLDAVSVASKQVEERTYGKISQLECVLPWENVLRRLRMCLLVCLRLAGDVSPTGAVNPMTVKSVSQAEVFSTYAWVARDELSLSHDNQVLIALESACLSSAEAFYPSSTEGDTVPHKRSVLESCSCHRPNDSLRNPTGLTNDDHSRPLIFYLKDHAKCTAHLAAHRALILAGLWGQTPDNLILLNNCMAALEIVLNQATDFSLAVLVEIYQTRIRPVCRAMIFGFDDVHELSQDIVLPLINNQSWSLAFSAIAKKILKMIANCKPVPKSSPAPMTSSVDVEEGMWPPLREDPVMKGLKSKLRDVQLSSVELHHTVIFAASMTNDIHSLESILPSFSDLFLLGSLSVVVPAIPKGSDQQRKLIDEAIVDHVTKMAMANDIVDHFDIDDIEWVGKAWGLDPKYVRTRFIVEILRLGKDAIIDDLLGSCIGVLDKNIFVSEVLEILCARLDATITSLKRSKNYRAIVSLLDADTSRYVHDVAAKLTTTTSQSLAPVSLIATHALMLRTQGICEGIADDSTSKNIDALSLMSGTLLKAVQAQEQKAAVL